MFLLYDMELLSVSIKLMQMVGNKLKILIVLILTESKLPKRLKKYLLIRKFLNVLERDKTQQAIAINIYKRSTGLRHVVKLIYDNA